jgi:hypothetical protein
MIFTYAADGNREPFDPHTACAHLEGCILCGKRVATVGIFIPQSPEMHSVVLRLRRHPQREQSTSCIAYGLCRKHSRQEVTTRVEAVLVATAREVTVQ